MLYNIFEKNYNATYFTTIGNDLDQYGILNVTMDNMLNYDIKTIYIQNDKIYKTSWKDYKHYIIHPCNSIIFIDNYILKNEKSINTDFSDIIELLIPKVSKVPIHITVVTNELKISLENAYKLAYETIKKKCPNVKFNLGIFKSDKFHDRCIITNNSYITSGSGFDLFQGKGKTANTTTISQSYRFYDITKTDNIIKLIIEQVKKGKPLLGICLGMQLLFDKSLEYGEHKGLGLIKGEVRPIEEVIPKGLKIPHIGWNALNFIGEKSSIFKYISEGDHVYFVHSYYATGCSDSLLATAEYGKELTAAVAIDNIAGIFYKNTS